MDNGLRVLRKCVKVKSLVHAPGLSSLRLSPRIVFCKGKRRDFSTLSPHRLYISTLSLFAAGNNRDSGRSSSAIESSPTGTTTTGTTGGENTATTNATAAAEASAAASWNVDDRRRGGGGGRPPQDFDAFGTWDSTTDLPLLIEESIAVGKPIPNIMSKSIGISSVKGRRRYMEDYYGVEQLAPNLLYWAVFDGHGGADCSNYCAQHMPRHIAYWVNTKSKEMGSGDLDLTAVLHNSFLELNNSFARWYTFSREGTESDSSGSTATVVILQQDKLLLAIGHVGDSRAILCRGGEARKLTTDHVPSLITEKTRIEKSGGKVSRTRVNDRLAMTRSLGDMELKTCGVICSPEVRSVDISHSRDAFIVLTTDGINSVMTDKEIIETVKQAEDPTEAAHLLTDTAVQYNTEDNCTAIVTPLGAWGQYSAAATIFHSFGKSFGSSSRFG